MVIRSNELLAIFTMHGMLIFFQLKFVDSIVYDSIPNTWIV